MFRKWLTQCADLIRAVHLVETCGEQMVAVAMYHLNHRARASRDRQIYAMKNHLVRIFYERGLCTSVSLQEQKLTCWHTWDYNEGWEDYCCKCGNTGIYRRHHLYRFVFDVDGVTYVWHQPESLVTWPVQITEPGVGEYKGHTDWPRGDCSNSTIGQFREIVRYYLFKNGVHVAPKITLRRALWHDWRVSKARRKLRKPLAWYRGLRIRLGYEDDIPF